jgi:selenocysteine lyase/cysteine desulfurase
VIYLNNGATSWPKPSCVYEAVQACLTGTPASQFRGGSDILKKDAEELCREKLGKLLNISDYHRIFFTSGATESMNTLLCGLNFGEEGQAVLATQSITVYFGR